MTYQNFVKDFMAKNKKRYTKMTDAIRAAAAEWRFFPANKKTKAKAKR
jgi:hypothetical protein